SHSSQSYQSSRPSRPSPAGPEEKPARRRTSRKSSTIRISDPAAAGAVPSGSLDTKREPVTEETLATAWQEFAAANPDLHILISAMRSGTPAKAGEDTFTFTVGHPAQAQAFESAMPRLMQFLRERLNNDSLVINILIDSSREPDRTLPPQEFLRKAVEGNPALGTLLANLDAELVG
ncbi:MAG: hypothetical protein K2O24_08965, partial [Muribaculaceae bacterium]|nr:hypothetical protein [Muribaculaceae bacterium]